MGQTETTTIGNTASAHHSLTKSNNVTFDFIFDDVSYSFSGLNWNIDTIKRNNFWILGDLENRVSPFLFTFISCLLRKIFFIFRVFQFGPFQNVQLIYAVATFLGLCYLLLCFFAAVCNGSYITVSRLQIVEVVLKSLSQVLWWLLLMLVMRVVTRNLLKTCA